jgi:hypothetical protein
MQKQEVLSLIISHGGMKIEEEDFSVGSTITRAGLERACVSNGVAIPYPPTKKNTLMALLKHVNKPYIEGDVRRGSTIEKIALIRILEGLKEISN